MQFGILGPLEVWGDGQQLGIGGPQQRALLAILLLNANRVVSAERLITCLWGEQPPTHARDLLQGRVAALRRALRVDARAAWWPLVTRAPGYLLVVHRGELDLDQFEELAAGARGAAADDLPGAAVLFGKALALWRGSPLEGITLDVCRMEANRLEEYRLAVLEERIDVDLRLGRHAGLTAELRALVRTYPLREGLWARLMRALYGADRRADALAAYRELRDKLVEQLGVEPSAPLRRLQRDILTGSATEPGPHTVHHVSQSARPEQLPASITAFAGRVLHLKQLDELLNSTTDHGVPVSLISGTAGVGKTTLAVHWAHGVRDRFPDGQLYIDLRGFDPSGHLMSPTEAVCALLTTVNAPPHPTATLHAQVALYRSLLSGRRFLIVLDNAREVEQVRPLLPGTPGCCVLVTSRNQLSGLIAREGARPLTLDLLTATEAREMLAGRLGQARIAGEPDAVADIVTACARLPLALSIAAARASARPHFSIAVLAAQLREARSALDVLADEDTATDLRRSFSWSYHALSDGSARLFRLLGLHPGPNITVHAAASLTGISEPRVRPLVAELTRAHLLTERTPGRYTLHLLLRAYAIDQTHQYDSVTDRQAAMRRLRDRSAHQPGVDSLGAEGNARATIDA